MIDMVRRHEAAEDGRCRHCNSTLPRPDVTCLARWPADAPAPAPHKGRTLAAEDESIFARMTELRREREQIAANMGNDPMTAID